MHTNENVDSSNNKFRTNNKQVQEQLNWFEVLDDLDTLDTTLINPFLIRTPQSLDTHQHSNKLLFSSPTPECSPSKDTNAATDLDCLPELDVSQSTQSSTQIQTPPSAPYSTRNLHLRTEIDSGYTEEHERSLVREHYHSETKPYHAGISRSLITPPEVATCTKTITLQSPFKTPQIICSPLSALGNLTPGRKRSNSGLFAEETTSWKTSESSTTLELDSPFRNLGLLTPQRQRKAHNLPFGVTPFTPTLSQPVLPTSSLGLNSPFKRLGLGTPGKQTARSLPKASDTSPSDRTPSPSPRHSKRKPQLYTPSPEWTPDDTPTPYRFYKPSETLSKPSYDLSIPPQPLFVSPTESPQTPSKDIKPVLPLTPPYINSICELPLRNGSQAGVSINFITHVSTDGGLVNSLRRLQEQMIKMGSNAKGLNMFIHPPKKSVQQRDEKEVLEAAKIFSSLGESFRKHSMAHAVHTTNLLSPDNDLRGKSKKSIIAEMELAFDLGIPTLVIHLGSERKAVKEDDKIDRDRMVILITDLKEILGKTKDVVLAIENTVHPSFTSLTTLKSLALLLTLFPHPRLKLCLDLAHLHISELDLNDSEQQEDLFQMLKRTGKDRIAGIHLGGSWTEHGGRGDRHAGIGFGSIQLSSIRSILLHPLFHSIPTLLETPKYHRHFRQSRAKTSKYDLRHNVHHSTIRLERINMLEFERSQLECKFVQDIVKLSNEEWELSQFKVFSQYSKQRKRIGNEIYKLLSRKNKRGEGGNQWDKFRSSRKKEMIYSRRLQGKKRERLGDATRLGQVEQE